MVSKALKKYNGHTQIQNPHDPQARYSRKRSDVEGGLSELVRGLEPKPNLPSYKILL